MAEEETPEEKAARLGREAVKAIKDAQKATKDAEKARAAATEAVKGLKKDKK